jgi:carbamoyl-phosphate synthase small subunit
MKGPPALLALEDGTVYRGTAFGAPGECDGEVVFTTAMSGYQEILTDPSFCGQIVTMTYPLIGNYGVVAEDMESDRIWARGFVVRELSRSPSNFRMDGRLEDWLSASGVVGIEGVDTRALTRRIRTEGAMRGVISTTGTDDPDSLVDRARSIPSMIGRDLVKEVTRTRAETWEHGFGPFGTPMQCEGKAPPETRLPIVAVDYGVKLNILRNLVHAGFDVTVVPGTVTADEILERKPTS